MFFNVQKIFLRDDLDLPILLDDPIELSEDEVSLLFIRTDPPFDSGYLQDTWLLDLVKDRIAIINDPSAIRSVNEKIWCTQFKDLVPS